MMMKFNEQYVDVSHGLGIPFGGIGTGYSVFGKYGFIDVNFDSAPNEDTKNYPHIKRQAWDYTFDRQADGPMAFVLQEGDSKIVFAEKCPYWLEKTETADSIKCYAYLPKGYFVLEKKGLDLEIMIEAFSPMIPHNLEHSCIPVQIFNVFIKNTSPSHRSVRMSLLQCDRMRPNGQTAVYNDKHGQVAFYCADGSADYTGVHKDVVIAPGQTELVRFIIAWHYPYFKTFSPDLSQFYCRYYTKLFKTVLDVVAKANSCAEYWSAAIDEWHNSLCVPAYFKRLWFSSLSSAICSTMISDDPYFFEIETPHHHVDTMDVNAYSSWLYLINWPELEKMEIRQFIDAVRTCGPKAGFVWHSLWDDPLEYSEEPTFITRVYRDVLWFDDDKLLADGFEKAVCAANYVYNQNNFRGLLNSPHGNQSFDAWPMPGVSSYVNCAWLYSLFGILQMAERLKKNVLIGDKDVGVLLKEAEKSYDDLLWNSWRECWNLFYRTPDAASVSEPESVFTDQLFGRWMLLIDKSADKVLDLSKVRSTLEYIYRHNAIEDSRTGFKGWVNGLMPGRKLDPSGHICKAFWICPQLDLGSLLGDVGSEDASLDVFSSVERSLFNNHLAVGEYNHTLTSDLNVVISPEEPAKDTPRFPPYPRYKCCWEYLVRLVGFKLDWENVYLKPFKNLSFEMKNLILGGVKLNISVQAGWTKVLVNGCLVDLPVKLPRGGQLYAVEFLK